MRSRSLHLLLACGLLLGTYAQPEDSLATGAWAEPEQVTHERVVSERPVPELRSFHSAAMEQLRAEHTWKAPEKHRPGLWERFLAWLGRQLGDALGTGPASWLLRNLWVILIVVAAVLILITLRKRLFTGAFGRSTVKLGEVTTLHAEVQADDLDERIRTAETEGAWRRALRLYYLRALRRLADQGHITLRADATDRDYLRQVKDRELHRQLEGLAHVFQWVWYGEVPLDHPRYEQLIGAFRRFDPTARS